jgi:hypothetical protein
LGLGEKQLSVRRVDLSAPHSLKGVLEMSDPKRLVKLLRGEGPLALSEDAAIELLYEHDEAIRADERGKALSNTSIAELLRATRAGEAQRVVGEILKLAGDVTYVDTLDIRDWAKANNIEVKW